MVPTRTHVHVHSLQALLEPDSMLAITASYPKTIVTDACFI